MSWLAEVRHVFLKDMHQARWLVLAYVVLVILATIRAVAWRSLDESLVTPGPLVLLVGIFLMAYAMQADSPIRSDAFWAAHPFRPSAILGAKVLFALAMIVIGVAGQTIALTGMRLSWLESLGLALDSVGAFGTLLLLAMLAAALLHDLRSFAILIVLLPFTSIVLAIGLQGRTIALGRPLIAIARLDLLASLAGIGLLAWLYRRRDAGTRVRLAGAAGALMIAFVLAIPSPDGAKDFPRIDGPMPPISLEPIRGGRLATGGPGVWVQVRRAEDPGNARLALIGATLDLTLRDGTTLRAEQDESPAELFPAPPIVLPDDGRRWIMLDEAETHLRSLGFELDSAERRALDAGVTRMTLEGRLLVVEPRIIATLPLDAGSDTLVGGAWVRVGEWQGHVENPSLEVHTRAIVDRRRADLDRWLWDDMRYALANPATGEVLPLEPGRASGSNGWFVLPGVTLRRSETELSIVSPGQERAWDRDAWLRNAQLLVITHEVRGSYPLRLERTVE